MASWSGDPGASGDDGYVLQNGSFFDNSSTELFMGRNPTPQLLNSFIRFTPAISSASSVSAADVSMFASLSLSSSTMALIIYCVDEPAGSAAPTGYSDWSTDHSNHTSGSATWAPGNWTAGTEYTSSDISSPVGEIITDASWGGSGTGLQLHIDDNGSSTGVNRRAASYDHATYDPPTLSITYATGQSIDIPEIDIGLTVPSPTLDQTVFVPEISIALTVPSPTVDLTVTVPEIDIALTVPGPTLFQAQTPINVPEINISLTVPEPALGQKITVPEIDISLTVPGPTLDYSLRVPEIDIGLTVPAPTVDGPVVTAVRPKAEIAWAQTWEDYATWSWSEVTTDILEASIDRGGDYTARFNAGQATIVFANTDGDYTPGNTSGANTPNVVPGVPVRLSIDIDFDRGNPINVVLFTGYIWEWAPSWSEGGLVGECTATAVDGLSILNLATIDTTIASAVASTQVTDVLDAISWPAGQRFIETSDTTHQALLAEAIPALEALRLISDTERGAILCNRTGDLVFWDDDYLDSVPTRATLSNSLIRDAVVSMDDRLIFNQADVFRVGGSLQTSSDATSQSKYGPRTLRRFGTLHNTNAAALTAAQALVADYKDPQVRIRELTLLPEANLASLALDAATRDLGDKITVDLTPQNSATLSSTHHIEGITHTINRDRQWEVRWRLTPKMLPNFTEDGDTISRNIAPQQLQSWTFAATIESDNFSAGSAGWQIKRSTGDAEFNNVTVRGTIYATAGTIDSVSATNLTVTSGSLVDLSVTGTLTLSGSGIIRTDDSGARIEITNATKNRIDLWTGAGGESAAAFVQGTSGNLLLSSSVVSGVSNTITVTTTGVTLGKTTTATTLNTTTLAVSSTSTFTGTMTVGAITGSGAWSTTSTITAGGKVQGATLTITSGPSSFGGAVTISSGGLTISAGGATIAGDSSVSGNLDPNLNNAFDLGDSSKTWRRGYFYQLRDENGTLIFNMSALGATVQSSTSPPAGSKYLYV